MTLEVGKYSTITPTIIPSDAGYKTVKWTSSNNDVATVSSAGRVTAKSAGYAKITATTTDGGKSWSDAKELVQGDESGGRGPVKNKPIRLSSGRILAPCSTEQGRWLCFAEVSDDDGNHFEKVSIPASDDANMIQPCFWEDALGGVHALMRTDKGFIYRSDSTDAGESWCPAYPIEIPNNNSGLDCIKADNGAVYLICNPVSENWGARSPLTLYKYKDSCEQFERMTDLESGDGEFSYPAIICADGKLYGTYTYKREGIVFWEETL
jgi:predicted neuraminidase